MPVDHFRAMARNNAWSNYRLGAACSRLSHTEFTALRTGFFRTIRATLNHILTVDWYYIGALEGDGRGLSVFDPPEPCSTVEQVVAAQWASDRRLMAFCDRLQANNLERYVFLVRPDGTVSESVGAVLQHLFVHQIHHRGQVHAMLSGTAVKPPQLDEFFLNMDGPLRAEDIKALDMDAG